MSDKDLNRPKGPTPESSLAFLLDDLIHGEDTPSPEDVFKFTNNLGILSPKETASLADFAMVKQTVAATLASYALHIVPVVAKVRENSGAIVEDKSDGEIAVVMLEHFIASSLIPEMNKNAHTPGKIVKTGKRSFLVFGLNMGIVGSVVSAVEINNGDEDGVGKALPTVDLHIRPVKVEDGTPVYDFEFVHGEINSKIPGLDD